MRKTLATALAALSAAAVAGSAAAADRATVNFMQKAGAAGLAEVQISRLALGRSNDQEIRRFAQRMVDDHSRANDELQRLARREGVSLPSRPDSAHRQAYDRLQRLRGNNFDRAYMDVMAPDHEQAVTLFRTEARNGRDRDVRDWAARVLPTLQGHRQMAHDVRRDEIREARRY